MLMLPEKETQARYLALAEQEWGPVDLAALREMKATESAPPAEEGRSWYILQCEPQRERTAAAHLVGRRFKVYLPTEKVKRTFTVQTAFGKKQQKRTIEIPIFPGYLFAKLDFQLDQKRLRFIHAAPGVRGGSSSFLKRNDRPVTIDARAMDIIERIERGEKIKAPSSTFKVGQQVKVIDGPFAFFPAVVEQILKLEPEERIIVLVDIFGRPTPVDVEATQLRSL